MSTAVGLGAARVRTQALSGAFYSPCTVQACQRRASSAVSLLDKLHRKQKQAVRDERAASALRASSIEPPPLEAGQPLPYHITRTAGRQLPVYLDAKRGGNLHQTRVRKIEGDIIKLRDDLRIALGLNGSREDQEKVVINQLTKHVIIKGWRKPEVETFLEKRGF